MTNRTPEAKAAIKSLPPGSDAAVAAGCLCPVWDNHKGKGWHGQAGVYAIMGNCPLHGATRSEAADNLAAEGQRLSREYGLNRPIEDTGDDGIQPE